MWQVKIIFQSGAVKGIVFLTNTSFVRYTFILSEYFFEQGRRQSCVGIEIIPRSIISSIRLRFVKIESCNVTLYNVLRFV